MLQTVRDLKDLEGKRVLLRCDFNVPVNKDGDILDDSRIIQALPTIRYLVERNARVIICSHLGRPKGYDKYLSLLPVAVHLMKYFPDKVRFCEKSVGPEAQNAAQNVRNGEILLLENTRFDPREEENDPEFVQELASLADVFVNDAFGTAHRKHASTYGVAIKLPSAIGFLIEKEINVMEEAINNPKRPFVAIFGGAKVGDKLTLLHNIVKVADTILIGGGMAYTFLLAQGHNIGNSIVALDLVNEAKNILNEAEQHNVKIVLPVDHLALQDSTNAVYKTTQLEEGFTGLDIGNKTIALFKKEIAKANQIIWNGPLGKFEDPRFKKGTYKIAKALARCGAYTIVGGGDSLNAVKSCGVEKKMGYLSTGGSASLKLLAGQSLVALDVIDKI